MSNTCIMCGKEFSVYKCPNCRARYCSVQCCKKHKETACELVLNTNKKEVTNVDKEYTFPTEDTVNVAKLKLLETCPKLRQLLLNPHLRALLSTLDKSKEPHRAIREAMQEPLFVEFSDACMLLVDPPNSE